MKQIKFLMVGFSLISGSLYAGTCDQLASSPYDKNKAAHIEGVEFDEINAEEAISVCSTELAKDPENLRLQFQLGRAYNKAEQYDKGLEWVTKSAHQDYAPAQNLLGYMYDHGEGVEQNERKAFAWYEKAAKQGFSQAQHNLATSYFHGMGVDRNRKIAKEWFNKACNNGYEEACDYR